MHTILSGVDRSVSSVWNSVKMSAVLLAASNVKIVGSALVLSSISLRVAVVASTLYLTRCAMDAIALVLFV
jgi:fumarylacetoacetate (FAA) hydrolase family protein